jgi:hypothetical protein
METNLYICVMKQSAYQAAKHSTRVVRVCELNIPDPDHGDLKLSVFPFEHTEGWITLPEGFKKWETALNKMMSHVPIQKGAETHYITIDSKFFTTAEYLRREGVHVDGNFCVDPEFTYGMSREDEAAPMASAIRASWGGGIPTWGGGKSKGFEYKAMPDNSHVQMDWVLPYNLMIPIGTYISAEKGGILTVSTEVGCQAWAGEFEGEVLSGGDFSGMQNQLTDEKKIVLEKNTLYFMSSNTPHETLMIGKGKRRTFMRVTLNHEYKNGNLF